MAARSSKAVITVPAFFNDNQRQATHEAGELAGLEVVRIINEPTAAALVYEPHSSRNERLLVYDLGGGTFDVSIVQIEPGVIEVLASHGDTQLGGDDFDQLLLDLVSDDFADEHGVDLRGIPIAKSRLLQAVEEAKMRLSIEAYTTIAEEFIAEKDGRPLHLNMEIDRTEYEELIEPLLRKTLHCVDAALGRRQLQRQRRSTRWCWWAAARARRWCSNCCRSSCTTSCTAKSIRTCAWRWAPPCRAR